MQRIEAAVDEHDAKLAKHPLAVSRVKLFDQPHIVARKLRNCGRQGVRRCDTNEMMPGVKARRTH